MISVDIPTEFVTDCPVCGETERKPLYRGLRDQLFGVSGEWSIDSCIRCGCAYLNPRPTLAEIDRVYTECYAARKPPGNPRPPRLANKIKAAISRGFLANTYGYIAEVSWWQQLAGLFVGLSPYHREQLSYQVVRLRYQPNGRLLDVGCGNGELLAYMSRLGWRTEGIDTDPKLVRVCRERGLDVKVGTLEAQSYPEHGFDAITVKHVIEHVHDPLSLLRECARILKPGGQLVVLTPNLNSLGHKLFGDAWIGLDPSRHLVLFTLESISMLARKAGLKVLALSSTTRITSFDWRVSYELKVRRQTAYVRRAFFESRLVEHLSDTLVRLARVANKQAGDELVLIATK